MEMTRDGTAEPVSRDLFFRHERRQGNTHFITCSADYGQDGQPYLVDPFYFLLIIYVMTIHTYYHPLRHHHQKPRTQLNYSNLNSNEVLHTTGCFG